MISENLDDFINDDFAINAVVIDNQSIIQVIFDRPYSDDLDIQGFSPSMTMKTQDANEFLQRGYRVEIEGAVFQVVLLEPDGTGITKVILEAE